MINELVLNALVGARMSVRQGKGDPAPEEAPAPVQRVEAPVDMVVLSVTKHSQLELATDDARALTLDGRPVVAETTSGGEVFRVHGTLEVVVHRPRTICILTPRTGPEAPQRRQWLRVRTVLPVLVTIPGKDTTFETTSLDLSGGGVRLREGAGLMVDSLVRLLIELPSGPVKLDGQVVGITPEGSASVRFLRRPEAVSQRIIRHVYDVQLGRATRVAR